jgi:Pentapeptide repeats (8 copies)
MADQSHLDILQQGVRARNSWKERNPSIKANLTGADLLWADLSSANLSRADLSGASLRRANLARAILISANLTEADLSDASLVFSNLAEANLQRTTLDGCRIYGISAWNLKLEGTKQQNLDISGWEEPAITVDNLEVAQFAYLLLHNEKIRDVIDTIGEKGVLILGRFTEERKAVLDAIRDRLRELGFVPMMFDFERPTQQDFDETIKTLAGLSRFSSLTSPTPSRLPWNYMRLCRTI